MAVPFLIRFSDPVVLLFNFRWFTGIFTLGLYYRLLSFSVLYCSFPSHYTKILPASPRRFSFLFLNPVLTDFHTQASLQNSAGIQAKTEVHTAFPTAFLPCLLTQKKLRQRSSQAVSLCSLNSCGDSIYPDFHRSHPESHSVRCHRSYYRIPAAESPKAYRQTDGT